MIIHDTITGQRTQTILASCDRAWFVPKRLQSSVYLPESSWVVKNRPPGFCCAYGKPWALSSENAGFPRPSSLFSLDMVWGFLYGDGTL